MKIVLILLLAFQLGASLGAAPTVTATPTVSQSPTLTPNSARLSATVTQSLTYTRTPTPFKTPTAVWTPTVWPTCVMYDKSECDAQGNLKVPERGFCATPEVKMTVTAIAVKQVTEVASKNQTAVPK